MKVRTEIKIGLIVIVTIIIAIWGINYLKGKNIIQRTDVYYSVYENARGLEFAAPVYINGYKVGLINRIYFDSDNLNRIIVAIVVDKRYKIPVGSIARISSADILGSKSIEIELSESKQYHSYGDTLFSIRETDMISKLQSSVDPLLLDMGSAIIRLDSLLQGVNQVFNQEGIAHLQSSLNHIHQVTAEINHQLSPGGNLNKSLDNLESFSSALGQSKESLQKTLVNLEAISDTIKNSGLGTTIEQLGIVSDNLNILLENINSGEGSLGMLTVDKSLYNKLVDVSTSLDLLFQDLKEHPKRYVHFSIFGRKEKEGN